MLLIEEKESIVKEQGENNKDSVFPRSLQISFIFKSKNLNLQI